MSNEMALRTLGAFSVRTTTSPISWRRTQSVIKLWTSQNHRAQNARALCTGRRQKWRSIPARQRRILDHRDSLILSMDMQLSAAHLDMKSHGVTRSGDDVERKGSVGKS